MNKLINKICMLIMICVIYIIMSEQRFACNWLDAKIFGYDNYPYIIYECVGANVYLDASASTPQEQINQYYWEVYKNYDGYWG